MADGLSGGRVSARSSSSQHSVRQLIDLRIGCTAAVRLHHLEFGKQREVVGRQVRMRTADDLVVLDPFRVERPEQTQGAHVRVRVEDVIDDTFKVSTGEEERTVSWLCKLQ